ncbi:28180_t:CDS:2, partial [Racocetra persica]
MSILKGALERLLAESQSSRQKELEQACTTALEKLKQEINYIAKKKAIKDGKLKAKSENDAVEVAPQINNSENGSISNNNTKNSVPQTSSSTDGSAGETSQRGAEKAAEKELKAASPTQKSSPSIPSQANSRSSISSSLFARAGEDLPKILADNYWQPFRIACGTSIPVNVRVLALDCLQKIIAHGLLKGSKPIVPPKNSITKKRDPKVKNQTNGFSDSNDLSFIDISETPFDNDESTDGVSTTNPSTFPNPARLIDDVVHTVCIGFVGPQTDQTVQLQILKVLLTLVTTEQCPVHGISLLKIIQTCCNIYCYSKSQVNQATAKAELTQISNFIVSRCEEFALELSKSELSKKVNGVDSPDFIENEKVIKANASESKEPTSINGEVLVTEESNGNDFADAKISDHTEDIIEVINIPVDHDDNKDKEIDGDQMNGNPESSTVNVNLVQDDEAKPETIISETTENELTNKELEDVEIEKTVEQFTKDDQVKNDVKDESSKDDQVKND